MSLPFNIGSTISSLKLPGLVLRLNTTELLSFDQDGAYTFPSAVPDGTSYSVSELSTPRDHSYTVTNASGTVQNSDITNVNVSCSTDILLADDYETLSNTPIDPN